MHSRIAIDIAAPGPLVFALALDVRRWPSLLPHYAAVHVLSQHRDGSLTARMVARRALVPVIGLELPVTWRARVWADPATLGLRFHHQGGATAGMDVTWRIEPMANGCRVTIEHVFAPRFRPWAAIVERLFTRPIASRTLASVKQIAEAVAAGMEWPAVPMTTAVEESETAPTAYPLP